MNKSECRCYGSGSGVSILYAIEARSKISRAVRVAGQIFTSDWQRVQFASSSMGVPSETHCPIKNNRLELLSHESAKALAYWLLAMPDEDLSKNGIFVYAFCIEVRLVKIEVKYSYETKEIGVGPTLGTEQAEKFVPREVIS